jgi:hypothetical protein
VFSIYLFLTVVFLVITSPPSVPPAAIPPPLDLNALQEKQSTKDSKTSKKKPTTTKKISTTINSTDKEKPSSSPLLPLTPIPESVHSTASTVTSENKHLSLGSHNLKRTESLGKLSQLSIIEKNDLLKTCFFSVVAVVAVAVVVVVVVIIIIIIIECL